MTIPSKWRKLKEVLDKTAFTAETPFDYFMDTKGGYIMINLFSNGTLGAHMFVGTQTVYLELEELMELLTKEDRKLFVFNLDILKKAWSDYV